MLSWAGDVGECVSGILAPLPELPAALVSCLEAWLDFPGFNLAAWANLCAQSLQLLHSTNCFQEVGRLCTSVF